MKVTPTDDRVLITMIETEKVGSILLPDIAKDKPQLANVVAVGPGRLDVNGNRLPVSMKPGDQIVVARYSGIEMELKGKKHFIIREDDVMGVVEK